MGNEGDKGQTGQGTPVGDGQDCIDGKLITSTMREINWGTTDKGRNNHG